MADIRGACKRLYEVTGLTDGCQEFEPAEFDPKTCDTCGCKRGFHEKIPSSVGTQQVEAAPPAAPVVPAPQPPLPVQAGTAAQGAAEGQPNADVQPSKKQRTGSSGTGGSSSGKRTSTGSTVVLDGPAEKSDARPPSTLQKNFEKCLGRFPAETFGNYFLERKSNGQWGIRCDPCNQVMAIQSNHTLSNFERTHINGAKHRSKLIVMRDAVRLKAEEEAAKEQKLRETRGDMVKKYAGQGKVTCHKALMNLTAQFCQKTLKPSSFLVNLDLGI